MGHAFVAPLIRPCSRQVRDPTSVSA